MKDSEGFDLELHRVLWKVNVGVVDGTELGRIIKWLSEHYAAFASREMAIAYCDRTFHKTPWGEYRLTTNSYTRVEIRRTIEIIDLAQFLKEQNPCT